MRFFLFFGYGIPKKILEDVNYNVYFRCAFNIIYKQIESLKDNILIFTGGKTDSFFPYKRTEAEEMKKLFQFLLKKIPSPLSEKNFKILLEKKALSTLENQIYCKDLILKNFGKSALTNSEIHIFCEFTRKKRILNSCQKIFGKKAKIKIHALDFDTSEQRYLNKKLLQNKEKAAIHYDEEFLKGRLNLKQYRAFFLKKFSKLKESDNKNETIKSIWLQSIKSFLKKKKGNA